MDHRSRSRLRIPMKLLLYRTGVPVAIGRIRDISARGLFVETDFDDFSPRQSLEVELLPRASTHIDRCRFNTVVARRARGGLGLAALDSGGADCRTLAALVDKVMARGGPGRHPPDMRLVPPPGWMLY